MDKQKYVGDCLKPDAKIDPASKTVVASLKREVAAMAALEAEIQKIEASLVAMKARKNKSAGAVEALGALLWDLRPAAGEEDPKLAPVDTENPTSEREWKKAPPEPA